MTEQDIEVFAQLSAQRYLLEIVFSNAFAHDPDGFVRLMEELQRLTVVATTTAEPISTDEQRETALEMKARTAAHLQRFGRSVSARISSGKSV